jgi:hypothetical protein
MMKKILDGSGGIILMLIFLSSSQFFKGENAIDGITWKKKFINGVPHYKQAGIFHLFDRWLPEHLLFPYKNR